MSKSWEDVVKDKLDNIIRTNCDTDTAHAMSDDAMLYSGICPKCKGHTSRAPEDANEAMCSTCGLQWHNMGSSWCEAEFTGQKQSDMLKAIKNYQKTDPIERMKAKLRGITT